MSDREGTDGGVGHDGPGGADPTAARVVAAARQAFRAGGLHDTTMTDVARTAGLARATVYRKFGSREQLLDGVMAAEMHDYLGRLDAMAAEVDEFSERVVEGYLVTLRYVRDESLLAVAVGQDGERGLAAYTVLAGPAIAEATDYLAGAIRSAQRRAEVGPVEPTWVAELIVRLCHSLLLTPGGAIPDRDTDAARDFARRVLVPLVAGRDVDGAGEGRGTIE